MLILLLLPSHLLGRLTTLPFLSALDLGRRFSPFFMGLVFFLYVITLILPFLSFFLILLSLLTELLRPTSNKLFNFLLLDLLLILLSRLSSLELLRLGLPFDHLVSNDVDGVWVVNTGSDVIFEFGRIALSVEVGVEEHSEIPG